MHLIYFIVLPCTKPNNTNTKPTKEEEKTCMEFRNKTEFIDANSSCFYSFNSQKKETP